jgi:hypothetical protein
MSPLFLTPIGATRRSQRLSGDSRPPLASVIGPLGRLLLVLLALFLNVSFVNAQGGPAARPVVNSRRDAAPVGPLHGTDLDGQLHRLGRSAECRGVLVVFLATQCPISNGYIPQLNQMATAYQTRGIEFYGVICDRAATRAEMVQHRRQFRIRFSVLFDAAGDLRDRLQATHTPQVFLMTPQGDIVYRGRIDDRHVGLGQQTVTVRRQYLADALKAVTGGKAILTAETEPIGCLIEEPGQAGDSSGPTYARDVAPIIQTHCADCHRPGMAAPFPLLTFSDVGRRARQVALVTEMRLMPPWKPEHGFGDFRDRRGLSPREIQILQEWAAAGAPEGNPADLPPPRKFAPGWQLGKPDLVLQMPEPFDVPADGPDIYQYFVIPTHLAEDRLVAAIEFRPGNPQVVHHASLYYDVTGAARQLDEQDPGPGYRRFGGPGFVPTGSLGGWALGVTPRRLPDHMGRPLQRRSDIVMQVHYHPTGKPEQDQSRLGIYFAPRTAHKLVAELAVANMDLKIPPGDRSFHHRASYELPVNTEILSASPHMHLLGRRIQAVAHLPDGRTVPLIRIRNWEFNWQDAYHYKEPIRLPAGTRIEVDILYDNSASNPHNPHSPPIAVGWGEESTDEMGICFFDVTTDRLEELRFLVRHNRDDIARQSARLKPKERLGGHSPFVFAPERE